MRLRAIFVTSRFLGKNPSTIPEKTRKIAYDYAIISEKFYHISKFADPARPSDGFKTII
jgi:hypothetical protein